MKCKLCNIGDLHFLDELWGFRWKTFWIFPKTTGYIFICDNCLNREVRKK